MSWFRVALIIGAFSAITQGEKKFAKMAHSCCGTQLSAKGEEVWLIGDDKLPYRFNGEKFVVQTGCAEKFAASADGYHWLIGCNHAAYRWNKTSTEMNKWQQMGPGPYRSIAAIGQDHAAVVSKDGHIYRYDGSKKKWEHLKCCAKEVAYGSNGEIWIIGLDDIPYKWDEHNHKWEMGPGKGFKNIDMADEGQLVATDHAGNLFLWDKVSNGWYHEETSDKCSSISTDGKKIYCISKDHHMLTAEFADTAANATTLAPGAATTTVDAGDITNEPTG